MTFSANNQRRRDEHARKWAALPEAEKQRIKAENAVESKILGEFGRKTLDNDLRNKMMELQREIKRYIRPCRETSWFAEFHVEKDTPMTNQQVLARIDDFRRILNELKGKDYDIGA